MRRISTALARFTNTIKTRDTYNKKRAKKAKKEKEAALKALSPQFTENFQLSDSEDQEAGSF